MNNPGKGYYANYGYASPEVIDRAVAGDPEACNEIRKIYEEYVKNYVRAQLRKDNRKDRDSPVEDILQTVWMGLFQDIRKFRNQ